MKKIERRWYDENGGFFGPAYLREYDQILTPKNTGSEIAFLERNLKLERGAKILDLACGHGRHAIELARRGYNVTGLDINSFFLRLARKTARRCGLEIRWVKSDIRNIPFENEFNVVVNLFSSFGYLENESADQQVICQVVKALKSGGRFVIDLINREKVIRYFRDKDWVDLSDGSRVLKERKFDLVSGRLFERTVRIRNGKPEEDIQDSMRLYTLRELIMMCEVAGLEFIEVYGNFDGQELEMDSERNILIFKKQ